MILTCCTGRFRNASFRQAVKNLAAINADTSQGDDKQPALFAT